MSLFDEINFEKRANNLKLPENDHKLMAYPLILKHFSEIEDVGRDDIIFILELIRGWSHKEKKYQKNDSGSLDFLVDVFNRVRQDGMLHIDEVMDVSVNFNNKEEASVFYHFINPGLYPIYSKSVEEELDGGADSGTIGKAQFETYLDEGIKFGLNDYQHNLDSIVSSQLKEAGYNYAVTSVRAMELCLTYGTE
jgi:hypothetical protein